MKKIDKGIVFSNDISIILSGKNAYNYNYGVKVSDSIFNDLRADFKKDVNEIFNGNVTIISENEMLEVNSFIGGEYPHCYSR